jgi:hypothetical protein
LNEIRRRASGGRFCTPTAAPNLLTDLKAQIPFHVLQSHLHLEQSVPAIAMLRNVTEAMQKQHKDQESENEAIVEAIRNIKPHRSRPPQEQPNVRLPQRTEIFDVEKQFLECYVPGQGYPPIFHKEPTSVFQFPESESVVSCSSVKKEKARREHSIHLKTSQPVHVRIEYTYTTDNSSGEYVLWGSFDKVEDAETSTDPKSIRYMANFHVANQDKYQYTTYGEEEKTYSFESEPLTLEPQDGEVNAVFLLSKKMELLVDSPEEK